MEIELPQNVARRKRATGWAYYYRKRCKGHDQYTRLPHPLDPRFAGAYERAASETNAGPAPGSVEAMIKEFLASPRFARIGSSAATKYVQAANRLNAAMGPAALSDVRVHHITRWHDTMSETPAMANRMLSCAGVMWRWAMARGLAPHDPTSSVERAPEAKRGGPWPLADVERAVAEMRPEIARAVALAFYTGARKSDVLALSPSNVAGDRLVFRQRKTGVETSMQIAPHVMAILKEIWPADGGPFLRGERGAPWGRGFDTQFSKERARIGLEAGRIFHGLRHTAATVAEEAQPGVAGALLGHTNARITERYTRAARMRRDADAAVAVIPILGARPKVGGGTRK